MSLLVSRTECLEQPTLHRLPLATMTAAPRLGVHQVYGCAAAHMISTSTTDTIALRSIHSSQVGRPTQLETSFLPQTPS